MDAYMLTLYNHFYDFSLIYRKTKMSAPVTAWFLQKKILIKFLILSRSNSNIIYT